MPRMVRGNVVLNVSDDAVQHYLQLGYTHTSPSGDVIESAVPTDTLTLQRLYLDQRSRINTLEQELAKLTSENNLLRSKATGTVKSKKSITTSDT